VVYSFRGAVMRYEELNVEAIPFKKFLSICANRNHPDHQKAWHAFDQRYRGTILRPVLAVTRSKHDIEEIVCKVLVRLIESDFKALRMFRGENEQTFRGYLSKISRFAAIGHVVREKLRREDELDDQTQTQASEVDVSLLHEHLVDLARAVQSETQKPEFFRERDTFVLVLRKVAGFRSKDVARIPLLNMNPHNVDVVVNRLTTLIDTRLEALSLI